MSRLIVSSRSSATRRVDEITPRSTSSEFLDLRLRRDGAQARDDQEARSRYLGSLYSTSAGVDPNPAKDGARAEPLRGERRRSSPRRRPTSRRSSSAWPEKYKLPLFFLDWSGARVSAIETVICRRLRPNHRKLRLRAEDALRTGEVLWVEVLAVLASATEANPSRLSSRPRSSPGCRWMCSARRSRGRAGMPAPHLLVRMTFVTLRIKPAACEGRIVGRDRPEGGAAEPCGHGEHVHARHVGRQRARPRCASRALRCLPPCLPGPGKVAFCRDVRVRAGLWGAPAASSRTSPRRQTADAPRADSRGSARPRHRRSRRRRAAGAGRAPSVVST